MGGGLFVASVLLAVPAPVSELPRGEVVEQVEIREDASLSYALYLPGSYVPSRTWPILYLFDARGRALVPVEVFQEAAERYGYILASSYDTASDDAIDEDIKVIRALWRDTHDRLAVDPRRVYMAGFSGLARVACLMADSVPGAVAGVIACGAGFSPARPPREGMGFGLFGVAGNTDFNHDEMVRLDATLDELGAVHRIEIFEGGHHWPPPATARQALEWMELLAMKAGTRPKDPQLIEGLLETRWTAAREAEEAGAVYDAFHGYLTLTQDFAGLRDVAELEKKVASLKTSQELEDWLKGRDERLERDEKYLKKAATAFARAPSEDPAALVGLLRELRIRSLKKSAAEARDEQERLSSRRRLESVFIQTAYYIPQHRLEQRDYEGAILSLSVAVEIKPTNPFVWFTLARAQALSGRRSRAIESLEHARDAGLTDAVLLEEHADLESLRDDEDFRRLVQELHDRPSS